MFIKIKHKYTYIFIRIHKDKSVTKKQLMAKIFEHDFIKEVSKTSSISKTRQHHSLFIGEMENYNDILPLIHQND